MNDLLDRRPMAITVMVYVDGTLVDEHTNSAVPAYAVNHVVWAAVSRVENPDLERAEAIALADQEDMEGLDNAGT